MPIEQASSEVARLIEQLRGASVVPNGTRKVSAGAVDALRYADAPDDMLAAAGDMAATIHKWELALCLGNAANLQAA